MAGAGGSGGTGAPQPPRGPLFPAHGATSVCRDATLRMRFDGKPSVATSGRISVFEVGGSAAPVAVVDLAAATVDETVGANTLRVTRPVYVGCDEVIVRLPKGALAYGKRYYVTVAAGAIRGPDGAALAVEGSDDWQFETRAAAPDDLSALRVAVDGTGDFCSVQGAFDALPAQSAARATITVAAGTYFELVHVARKGNFTLHGEDRKGTIILGVNNDRQNAGTAKRALVNIENASDITIEDLTIHNLTPQDGSQAEALRLANCDRCLVQRADILSLQDTLLWNGRVYARDCYIAGNVDFIWGSGAVLFERCEIKTVGRKGYVVQARNGPTAYGYVFVDSKISADPGITGIVLARIDASVYPGSQVAYVDCEMGSHIAPEGWTITGGAAARDRSPPSRRWTYAIQPRCSEAGTRRSEKRFEHPTSSP